MFKIGDRVRTLVDKDNLGTEIFPTGTIGEVVGINGDSIAVKGDTTTAYGYYRNDTLELVNDAILVGDEVIYDSEKCIVTAIANEGYTIMLLGLGGGYMVRTTRESIQDKRTGRHFPQIVEVLKQMEED